MASPGDSLVGVSSDKEAQNLKLSGRQVSWTVAIYSRLKIDRATRFCFEIFNIERPAVVTKDDDPLTENDQMEGSEQNVT